MFYYTKLKWHQKLLNRCIEASFIFLADTGGKNFDGIRKKKLLKNETQVPLEIIEHGINLQML